MCRKYSNQAVFSYMWDYDNVLEGLYNLKLPLQYFNKKGFYTVYIKPKEVIMTLQDVGVLASYEDIKGIVIDSSDVQL